MSNFAFLRGVQYKVHMVIKQSNVCWLLAKLHCIPHSFSRAPSPARLRAHSSSLFPSFLRDPAITKASFSFFFITGYDWHILTHTASKVNTDCGCGATVRSLIDSPPQQTRYGTGQRPASRMRDCDRNACSYATSVRGGDDGFMWYARVGPLRLTPAAKAPV